MTLSARATTMSYEYIVVYDFPEGCEGKDDGCDIREKCDKNKRDDDDGTVLDPITHEPIEKPFYRETYYTKTDDGDPGKSHHTGECVNTEPLRKYYESQPEVNWKRKSIYNVETDRVQLPPVLTSAQVLARRMVAYIDDSTEERLAEIKELTNTVDLIQLEKPTEFPHEEGEGVDLRLLEVLIKYLEAHGKLTMKRCKAIEKLLEFLVGEGIGFRKDDDDDAWNDTDPFHDLFFMNEFLSEENDVDIITQAQISESLDRIKDLLLEAVENTRKRSRDDHNGGLIIAAGGAARRR